MGDLNTYHDLDSKIKKSFALFEGKRLRGEDEKIYNKIYDLCFNEMLDFIVENLSEAEINKLTQELDRTNAQELILAYLTKIENYRYRLNRRLNYFITNLVATSVANRRNRLKTI